MNNFLKIPFGWFAAIIYSGLLTGLVALPARCQETPVPPASDLSVIFATQGIDRYGDETPVRDGEKYALVYAKKQSEFKGFLTSGQLVDPTNNVLVYCEGLAKDGRCLKTQVTINDPLVKPSGTLYVILLDTRAPDGTVGRDNLVLGYGIAGQTKGFPSGMVVPGSGVVPGNRPDGSTHIDKTTQPPSDIPPPIITAIHVVDGFAHIHFNNSRADVYYALAQKKNSKDWTKPSFNAYRKGGSKPQDEIMMSAPADEELQLFKVIVPDLKQNQ
jgi:hypothetical protein